VAANSTTGEGKLMTARIVRVQREGSTDYTGYALELILVFKNSSQLPDHRTLFESKLQHLEEGKTKNWGKGYSYRVDNREEHHAGKQIRVFGPKGKSWTYRFYGSKSGSGKNTLPNITVVRNLVADILEISKEKIEQMRVIEATDQSILMEISLLLS